MTAIAYSVATGGYTIEQLEGEDCARCGKTFAVGEASRPVERIGDAQLFAHVECPKVGATR
ncbi:MAG: hypothetical protein ACJ786_21725 [Catenulispora sp.]